jgi:hypothetical protein
MPFWVSKFFPQGLRGVSSGVPSAGDLELSFYDKFLWSRGLEPYPVQEQAIT